MEGPATRWPCQRVIEIGLAPCDVRWPLLSLLLLVLPKYSLVSWRALTAVAEMARTAAMRRTKNFMAVAGDIVGGIGYF